MLIGSLIYSPVNGIRSFFPSLAMDTNYLSPQGGAIALVGTSCFLSWRSAIRALETGQRFFCCVGSFTLSDLINIGEHDLPRLALRKSVITQLAGQIKSNL